jgi:hypothetical protein
MFTICAPNSVSHNTEPTATGGRPDGTPDHEASTPERKRCVKCEFIIEPGTMHFCRSPNVEPQSTSVLLDDYLDRQESSAYIYKYICPKCTTVVVTGTKHECLGTDNNTELVTCSMCYAVVKKSALKKHRCGDLYPSGASFGAPQGAIYPKMANVPVQTKSYASACGSTCTSDCHHHVRNTGREVLPNDAGSVQSIPKQTFQVAREFRRDERFNNRGQKNIGKHKNNSKSTVGVDGFLQVQDAEGRKTTRRGATQPVRRVSSTSTNNSTISRQQPVSPSMTSTVVEDVRNKGKKTKPIVAQSTGYPLTEMYVKLISEAHNTREKLDKINAWVVQNLGLIDPGKYLVCRECFALDGKICDCYLVEEYDDDDDGDFEAIEIAARARTENNISFRLERTAEWYNRAIYGMTPSTFDMGAGINHALGDLVEKKKTYKAKNVVVIPDHLVIEDMYAYLRLKKFSKYASRDIKMTHMEKVAAQYLLLKKWKIEDIPDPIDRNRTINAYHITIQKVVDEKDTEFLLSEDSSDLSRKTRLNPGFFRAWARNLLGITPKTTSGPTQNRQYEEKPSPIQKALTPTIVGDEDLVELREIERTLKREHKTTSKQVFSAVLVCFADIVPFF